jgi:hypothetical protein
MFNIILENMKLHYQLLFKNIFLLSTKVQQISHIKLIKEIVINIRTKPLKERLKRIIKFEVFMRVKYPLQNLIRD